MESHGDHFVGLRFELFSAEPEASVAFYQDVLGFKPEGGSIGYWPLRNGSVVIGVGDASALPADHHFSPGRLAGPLGVGAEIVLERPTRQAVDELYLRVQTAIQGTGGELEPIRDRPFGLRDFRVVDPNGYYLRITHR